MTTPLATYSFLPWLRQGLSTRIAGTSGARATLKIELELVGTEPGGAEKIEPADRTVALYGPGDVVGIERRAIVRTEPLPWITNFEPNYLPFVEFYDEDFLWRYTPTAPFEGNRRLTPWVTLVVLREDEFKDPPPGQGALPFIDVADAAVFPAPGDLWAWAHVHASREITATAAIVDTDAAAVAQALQSAIASNPDEACSRLLCPRRLAPNEAYHAFLIPTFESGRLAGLRTRPRQDSERGALRMGPRKPSRTREPLADALSLLSSLVLPHRRIGRFRVSRPPAQAASGGFARRRPRRRRAAARRQCRRNRRAADAEIQRGPARTAFEPVRYRACRS